MHPLFGTAEQQQYPGYDQMYQQPNYGGQQFAPVQAQAPPPLNQQTGIYQHQPQQQVNYQNFQNFTGQQQQPPQQTMSPPPPIVQDPPKQKLPLPEEFIYLQTVLEELKSQCINAAGNPVSCAIYNKTFELFLISFY